MQAGHKKVEEVAAHFRFNEAAGVDPADARVRDDANLRIRLASMRPRG